MISLQSIIGLAVLVLSIGMIIVFSTMKRFQTPGYLRSIPAFQQLRRALGLAVENGKRLHVTLGNASISNANNTSALAGLSTLERVAQMSIISDRPPLATSGDGTLAILSQDTLRAAYRTGNALEQYDPDQGRLGGITPFSYIAGTLPVVHNKEISAHILVGNFGPEVAFLSEAANQEEAFCLAASDSLPAQAVLFASAQEPLIGEELYAIPAYLQAGPAHQASIRAQDILRWILVAALLGGVILEIVGGLLRIKLI